MKYNLAELRKETRKKNIKKLGQRQKQQKQSDDTVNK